MLIAPQTTQGGSIQGYHFPLPPQREKKRNLPGKQQAENFGNGVWGWGLGEEALGKSARVVSSCGPGSEVVASSLRLPVSGD